MSIYPIETRQSNRVLYMLGYLRDLWAIYAPVAATAKVWTTLREYFKHKTAIFVEPGGDPCSFLRRRLTQHYYIRMKDLLIADLC